MAVSNITTSRRIQKVSVTFTQGSPFSMILRRAGLAATRLCMIGISSKNYQLAQWEGTLTSKKKLKVFISPTLSKMPAKP